MLAIDRRFDCDQIIFNVKNIYNRYSQKKQKHNKLSILLSKADANMKTNIMFTIIMLSFLKISGKREIIFLQWERETLLIGRKISRNQFMSLCLFIPNSCLFMCNISEIIHL